jgi:hypothetical protein
MSRKPARFRKGAGDTWTRNSACAWPDSACQADGNSWGRRAVRVRRAARSATANRLPGPRRLNENEAAPAYRARSGRTGSIQRSSPPGIAAPVRPYPGRLEPPVPAGELANEQAVHRLLPAPGMIFSTAACAST